MWRIFSPCGVPILVPQKATIRANEKRIGSRARNFFRFEKKKQNEAERTGALTRISILVSTRDVLFYFSYIRLSIYNVFWKRVDCCTAHIGISFPIVCNVITIRFSSPLLFLHVDIEFILYFYNHTYSYNIVRSFVVYSME